MSFSKASAACLLESGLDLPPLMLLLRSNFNFKDDLSLSGVMPVKKICHLIKFQAILAARWPCSF